MLRIDQPRAFPRALGLLLAFSVVVGTNGAAPAKARAKIAPDLGATDMSLPVAPPQARFFTINAVLAKHDGLRRAASGPAQLASTDPAIGARPDVASDAPPALAPQSDEPFGLMTFRAPQGLLWVKWNSVKAAMTAESVSVESCKSDDDRCSLAERGFVSLARAAAGADDPRTKAEIVNRGVNQAVRYVGDYQQHGVADLWSAPLQTLRAGVGDCEDYAIAKYSLLLAAGIAETDLKIMLVRDLAVRQDHAVLAVRLDGRWLVLDNRRSTLLEGRDVQSFMPLFAIDHRGVSLFAAPYAERPHHESEADVSPAADAAGTGSQDSAFPLML